jgi:hypothetical protein
MSGVLDISFMILMSGVRRRKYVDMMHGGADMIEGTDGEELNH